MLCVLFEIFWNFTNTTACLWNKLSKMYLNSILFYSILFYSILFYINNVIQYLIIITCFKFLLNCLATFQTHFQILNVNNYDHTLMKFQNNAYVFYVTHLRKIFYGKYTYCVQIVLWITQRVYLDRRSFRWVLTRVAGEQHGRCVICVGIVPWPWVSRTTE